MLGNIELNVDTTNNHPTQCRILPIHPLKKPVLFEIGDDVSIVTTVCALIFEPALFVCREHGTYHLVTVIPVHISIIST